MLENASTRFETTDLKNADSHDVTKIRLYSGSRKHSYSIQSAVKPKHCDDDDDDDNVGEVLPHVP